MTVTARITVDGNTTTFEGTHLTLDVASTVTPPPPPPPDPLAVLILADATNDPGGMLPRHLALRAVASGGTAPYTYRWTTRQPDAVPIIDSPTGDTFAGTWSLPGAWTFRCTVTDAVGATAAGQVTYTYTDPPVVTTSRTWKASGNRLLDPLGAPLGYYTVAECYFGSETAPPRAQVTEMGKVTAHPRILFDVPEANNVNFPGVSLAFIKSVLTERINAGDRVEVGLAGGKRPEFYALAKYRDVLLPLDPFIVLHVGENLTQDEAKWQADVLAGIAAIRGAGYKCPIGVQGMNGGRNVAATLRRFPSFITADPEHNLIAENQLYWSSPLGDHETIDGNLSDNYQRISGMSIRQAIDNLNATPYPTLIGVCGDQGDMPGKSVPFRGIIRYCQLKQQPWAWFAWAGSDAWSQLAWVWVTAGPPYGGGTWNPNLRDTAAATSPSMVVDGLHAAMPRTPYMLAQRAP